MRRILAAVLALTALMAMASAALAEDSARYDFASNQGSKNIQILPGAAAIVIIGLVTLLYIRRRRV